VAIKRKPPEHPNHERWLISYADFITLLFAFFVVMFASSQTDKAKAKQVSDSVREALEKGGISAVVKEVLGGTVDDRGRGNAMMKGPGGATRSAKDVPDPGIAELLPSLEYLNKELKGEIASGKMQIELQPRGLIISLRQAAFFPSGEDVIDDATYPIVEKVAETIRSLPNSVRLEGHTDSIPIHTVRFRSNWELSAARGIAMVELLAGRFGIPRQRLAATGYAETVPVASDDTAEGRSRNRRVDIVIQSHRAFLGEPMAAPAKNQPTEKPSPTARLR